MNADTRPLGEVAIVGSEIGINAGACANGVGQIGGAHLGGDDRGDVGNEAAELQAFYERAAGAVEHEEHVADIAGVGRFESRSQLLGVAGDDLPDCGDVEGGLSYRPEVETFNGKFHCCEAARQEGED